MPKKLPENLADIIRKSRKNFGLDQEDVARLLQVTPNTLNRWESGDAKPTGDNRKRLEFWISLVNDSKVERIIHNILKAPDGVLALGGFFGMLAGISRMVDRMGKGVLEEMVAPESTLTKAIQEYSGKFSG